MAGGTKPIVNRKSSIVDADGFTLIELLVVVSILALLMAILLPVLQKIRQRAKAVVCQSNLRQCGVFFQDFADDHEGWLPRPGVGLGWWTGPDESRRILRCPMTTKPAWECQDWGISGYGIVPDPRGKGTPISYGMNYWVYGPPDDKPDDGVRHPHWPIYWRGTRSATGSSGIPVFLDSVSEGGLPDPSDSPPLLESHFIDGGWMSVFCINRHDGAVNALFMDFSARRVGLKELWTLKWYRGYATGGPWTRAGGVEPGDWPPWMRGFKDY